MPTASDEAYNVGTFYGVPIPPPPRVFTLRLESSERDQGLHRGLLRPTVDCAFALVAGPSAFCARIGIVRIGELDRR